MKHWFARFAAVLILLSGLAFSPTDSLAASPQWTAVKQDPEAEMIALRLAEQCAASADRFWQRYGYDRPSAKTESWSYSSHYNREQKRCFVAVRLRTTLPSGAVNSMTDIHDAVDGEMDQPIASLYVKQEPPTFITVLRSGRKLEPTEETLLWFNAHLTK